MELQAALYSGPAQLARAAVLMARVRLLLALMTVTCPLQLAAAAQGWVTAWIPGSC